MKLSPKIIGQGYFSPPNLRPKNWIPTRVGKSKVKVSSGYRKAFRRRNYKNKRFYCPNCNLFFVEYVPRNTIKTICPFCRTIIISNFLEVMWDGTLSGWI